MYDGSNDSGQIEWPQFEPTAVRDAPYVDAQALFYDILGELYDGWENDNGSFGLFTWDVRCDRVTLVHNIRPEPSAAEVHNL